MSTSKYSYASVADSSRGDGGGNVPPSSFKMLNNDLIIIKQVTGPHLFAK